VRVGRDGRLSVTAGFRTGIISNSPWGSPANLWRAEVQRLELLDAVDVTAFCGDVGWRKPARAISAHAGPRATNLWDVVRLIELHAPLR
jgi:FMN phosphatase YigB (HAD superfamily)